MAYQPRSLAKPHILMFPWLAIGHITPYLHLANKLAERGFKTSFLLPNKAKPMVQHFNLHPHLISFHSLSIPHVDGLPLGTETTADNLPSPLIPLLFTAMDLTRPQVERTVIELKPDFVFYDLAYWVPDITSKLGIKSVSYNVVCAATLAIGGVPACAQLYRHDRQVPATAEELASPPPGYPSATVVLHPHEAYTMRFRAQKFGSGITFFQRINTALVSGDVIAVRTCRETEGKFCDYLSSQFKKPVLVTGPVLPTTDSSKLLDERWASWLGSQEPGSVVYCKFGTEVILDKEQFQEILLGIEMAGYPFLVALKPPKGCSTVEEGMPEGFEERVSGKGVVYGGGVQQTLLLKHPSVGCFVSHCGFGSMWEALLSSPQIVLVPQFSDQILSTRIMAGEMKVAVEVGKDEGGWVPKERLCRAVKEAIDKEGEVGCLIRENHAKWREVFGGPDSVLGANYIDSFVNELSDMI